MIGVVLLLVIVVLAVVLCKRRRQTKKRQGLERKGEHDSNVYHDMKELSDMTPSGVYRLPRVNIRQSNSELETSASSLTSPAVDLYE